MAVKVAVILPTYGHFDFALRAAKSLFDTTPGSHVFLIDDASKGWDSQDWSIWPNEVTIFHFEKNFGLTRSWNKGLQMARELGAEYTVCTNSDVLFSPHWFDGIEYALSKGVALAGPVTNAPGHRSLQNVRNYCQSYKLSDDSRHIASASSRLRNEHRKRYFPGRLNGFCLVAKTSTWWANSFNGEVVFNPKFKMARNEDEIQGRWAKAGLVAACVPSSFVFHYRGVTRRGATKGREGTGWFRPK